MNIVSAQGLDKTLGEKPLLRAASFGIEEGDRIGIIGVNGCGKSTLLRMLAGAEPADTGTIARRQGLRIAMLDQNAPFDPAHTALEHLFASGGPHATLVRDWERTMLRLERNPGNAALLAEQGRLGAQMDSLGAWAFESRARAVLGHLGLTDLERRLGELSGGERKRVELGRVLLAEPDLLLLDEPTNHLDADTIEWLEGWLEAFGGAVVLVTHDRYFLDRVTRRIWEIDRADLRVFEGNFQYYLEKKAELEADFAKKEDRRINQLRRELEWLKRGPKARTTKQKARKDRAAELASTSYDRRRERLELQTQARRLGRKIIEVRDLTFSYGGRPIVRGLDYAFVPGERLGVVGANGTGKTTLAGLIAGRLAPDGGTVDIGQTVAIAYFDQECANFDLEERAIDFVKREGGESLRHADGRVVPAELFLERFHFTPQMQYAPVGRLSGGERRRLYLVCTLLRDPNFLILDEPTNDLDIPTLQALEDYLEGFSGCVLAISHDRYFLDRVVDRVLAPEGDGTWRVWPGGFSDYAAARAAELERRREAERIEREKAAAREAARQAQSAGAPRPTVETGTKKKLGFNEQRELARLEAEIPEMEKRLEALTAQMAEAAADYERLHRLTTEQGELMQRLEAAMERWAELAERAG